MKKYYLITVVRSGCFSPETLAIDVSPAVWLTSSGTPAVEGDAWKGWYHIVFSMEITAEQWLAHNKARPHRIS